VITLADVEAAAARLAGQVRRTPVVEVEAGCLGTPGPVVLKLELLQHTGSFKARGALNRLLAAAADDAPARDAPARDAPARHAPARHAGVVAASGGNHGMAVAWAARRLGVPAEVFVPETSSPVKVARIRDLGATVVVVGREYAEAYAASTERAAATGALVVHAYDQTEVAAGQGTVGLELAGQASAAGTGLDTVLVAVGGGGLLAGVATALGPSVRPVAVEPERIPTLHAALAAGRPVDVAVSGLATDALGARRIGAISFAVARSLGVDSVLVPDEAIAEARRRLWQDLRVAAEAGGATALAALTSGAYRPRPGERVGVLVCGGNTDPTDLAPRT